MNGIIDDGVYHKFWQPRFSILLGTTIKTFSSSSPTERQNKLDRLFLPRFFLASLLFASEPGDCTYNAFFITLVQ